MQDVNVQNPDSSTGFPDVGRSGLYFGIVLIGANLRAPITGLGPVLPAIQHDLGFNDTTAGLLNSLPLLIFALLSPVAPIVGRRHGLERILGMALLGIALGTVIRSIAMPGALWFGTIVLSSGIAFANVLLPGLVKRDFPTHAAGLVGLYAAAMAGMAGLSAGLAEPVAHMSGLGWQGAIGIWALPALVALFVWMPQFRVRQHYVSSAITGGSAFVSPWRHPVGWQVSLFFAFHSLVFYSLVDWFASYAASRGISLSSAGFMLLVFQVVAVATNLGSAPVIRRLSDQKLLGFSCGLLLLIGTGGLAFMPDLSLLWLTCAGFGAGIAMVTSLSLFGLRTRDHHQAAALSGMAQFIGYSGAATGPLLVGLLHDATGGWIAPLWLLMGSSILAAVFATLAGRSRTIG
ncbi:major facilitator superfamily transporter [Komagataeibacter diospyri]|uniref:Major facilitator superfamily transporter n=1 Tax=Komagataeibacter diospyri TaxID=1932662 RepID=A0A4P5NLY9_9PROT|nr:major facilitator superfamily transporter [Komagataeibacter diospyri]